VNESVQRASPDEFEKAPMVTKQVTLHRVTFLTIINCLESIISWVVIWDGAPAEQRNGVVSFIHGSTWTIM
jgi:hypothetical protein